MKLDKARTAICLTALAPFAWAHAQTASAVHDSTEAQQRNVQLRYQQAQRRLQDAARDVAELSYRRFAPGWNFSAAFPSFSSQPMLGISIQDTDNGVKVLGVTPNGPAFQAGVEANDVIVDINGKSVAPDGDTRPTQRLLSELALVDSGDVVKLKVERDGKPMQIDVDTADSPYGDWIFPRSDADGNGFVYTAPGGNGDFEALPYLRLFNSGNRWAGMELVELSPELGTYFGTDKGLLVVSAPNDAKLGLLDGDVILDIGGRVPESPEHAMRILSSFEPSEPLTLHIMRQQRRQEVVIGPADASSSSR